MLFVEFGNSSLLSCPNSEEIEPCLCSYNYEDQGTDIICDGDIKESEIAEVFQASFPLKDFNEFIIQNNGYLDELSQSLFNDIYFF